MKRPHSIPRTVSHNPNQNRSSFFICNLIVRGSERFKTLMMLHEDLQIILFVVHWDIRFESVEAFAIQQTYELENGKVRSSRKTIYQWLYPISSVDEPRGF